MTDRVKHIVREILSTEVSYVDRLKATIEVSHVSSALFDEMQLFLEPLMIEVEKGSYIINEDYIKEIFGNIDDICTVNKELVEELKKRLDGRKSTDASSPCSRNASARADSRFEKVIPTQEHSVCWSSRT